MEIKYPKRSGVSESFAKWKPRNSSETESQEDARLLNAALFRK